MSDAPRPDRYVPVKEGVDRWAREAFIVLTEVASTYNATITYTDLAEEVQHRSHLRTRAGARTWVGTVLGIVVRACHQAGLPPLSALVVDKQDGMVGPGYDAVLEVAGLSPIADEQERELHAAAARLECYRRYCDDVPEDAEPTLVTPARRARAAASSKAVTSPKISTPKAPARKVEDPLARRPVCPRCFTQLPMAGGACSYCD